MKRIIALALATMSIIVLAATSYTTNYNLAKPADGDSNWGDSYRSNMDTIDSQMFINSNDIANHIADPTGAHAATAISTTVGGLCSTELNVQDYLDCLDDTVLTLTDGTVVTTDTAQTITGLKTFATTPILSALGLGLLHSDAGGNLTSSLLVNADVDPAAAVAYSKLNLTNSIVNADVNSAAAIAGTKISPDFGSQNVATTGLVLAGNGSAAAPSYSFTNSTGMGLYRVDDNELGFATSGVLGMRFGANGTLRVGTATPNQSVSIQSARNLTGATTVASFSGTDQIQSDVTTAAIIYRSSPTTQDTSFTLPTLRHFYVVPGTYGASSTVTTQEGFSVASTMSAATNNRSFVGNLSAASTSHNLYMAGTAQNYLRGNTGIGITGTTGGPSAAEPPTTLYLKDTSSNLKLRLQTTSNGPSSITQTGAGSSGIDLISVLMNNTSNLFTPSLRFGSSDPDFTTQTPKIGAAIVGEATQTYSADTAGGMGITFFTTPNDPGTTGALTDRMHLNHNGVLNLGASRVTSNASLYISRAPPSTSSIEYGIRNNVDLPAGGSLTDYRAFQSELTSTAGSTANITHFRAGQLTLGHTPTNQYGFRAASSLSTGDNIYGFYGEISSGSGRWNFYAAGSAQNYFLGNVGIGSGKTAPAVALDVAGVINTDTSLTLQDPGAGTNKITIQSPTLAGDYTLTLPVDDGNNLDVLTTNGSGVLSWSAAGAGDVVGPASAVADNVALFDGTTGKLIKDSGIVLAYGSYTPTASNAINCSVSGLAAHYTQVGKRVTVFFDFAASKTAGSGTETEVQLDLPISKGSNFSGADEAIGSMGANRTATSTINESGIVISENATQRVNVKWNAQGTATQTYRGSFMYVID
jgi:hypothetical protein